MLPGSFKSSLHTAGVGSPGSKKEVLWNVQQPGDSYDIKRSMIAKVPGEKSFMGDHLQFVCLFQAAEIQRLSDFLQSYKNRLKDIQRSNIDHHSYEIQIKELFERIAEHDSIKEQNFKMKDFVKKQSALIETLHKELRQNQSLNENYKGAFDQNNQKVHILTQENGQLKNIINQFNIKVQALEKAKYYQIEEIKKRTTKQPSESSLNLFKIQSQSELKKLQFELKNLKQQNQLKDQQIIRLKYERQSFEAQKNKYNTKSQNQLNLQKKLYQYETKISLFSQEIARLNIVIRDLSTKSENLKRNQDQYQKRITHYQISLKESEDQLKTSLSQMVKLNLIITDFKNQSQQNNQLQQYLAQQKSKINELNQENNNLKSQIKLEINRSKGIHQELERLNFENSRSKLFYKENSELKESINELKRHLAVLQNKSAIFNQQNEQLRQTISKREGQLTILRSSIGEFQSLKTKMRQTQISISKRYQSEILRVKSQYNNKVEQLSQIKGNQTQIRGNFLERQLQNYKELFKSKNQECQKQRIAFFQLQARFSRLQAENAIKNRNYQLNLANLKKQDEEFYMKTRQLAELQLRLLQFQKKTNYLQGQFLSIVKAFNSKEQQNLILKRRVYELQSNTQKFELDASRKIGGYEQYVSKYKAENEQLQRRLSQAISQKSKKDLSASVEMKIKFQLETANKQLAQQLEFFKQNIQRTKIENEELRKRIVQSQNKYINFYNQNSINFKNIQIQRENLRRQSVEYKNIISNLQIDISKRQAKYQQNLNLLTKDNQQLRKKLREIQGVLKSMSYELQNSNKVHLQKDELLVTGDRNYKNATVQLQNLKRYIKQYEVSVNNKFQGEVTRNYTKYENTIQNLNRQLEDFRNRYVDLQNKLIKLSQQYENADLMLKNSQSEIQIFRRQINQKDIAVVSIESEFNRKIANYEVNLANLTRSNHEAQIKINQKQSNIRQKAQDFIRLEVSFKNLAQQHQNLKKRYMDLEISVGQKLEGEVAQRYLYYEQNLAKITQENDELRRKLNELAAQLNKKIAQVNKLNALIPENESLKKTIQKYEISINAYQIQVNRRFSTYQQNIQTLSKQKEEVVKKIQEISQINRRINLQSEQRGGYITRQLQKITNNLKNVEKQNAQLRKKLIQTGGLSRNVVELESKFALTSQELERVNANLRAKCDQYNKSQLKIRNIMLDLEAAKRSISEQENRFKNVVEIQVMNKYNSYEQAISQLRKKLNESQIRNQNLVSELQRIGGSLKTKGEQSSQIFVSYKSLSAEYEELKKKAKELQLTSSQNLLNTRRQNEELRRKLQESEASIKHFGLQGEKRHYENENRAKILAQQIERLNSVVQAKNQEIAEIQKSIENVIANLNRENEELRRRFQALSEIHKTAAQLQGNLKIKGHQLERVTNFLKVRNEQYSKLDQRFTNLIQQNQKLQQILRTRSQELANADVKFRQFTIQIQNYKKHIVEIQKNLVNKYQVEINKKTTNFQQNISLIRQQREDFYKKKLDYQRNIGLLTTEIERLNNIVKLKNQDLQRSLLQAQSLRQNSQKKLLSSESELTALLSKYKTVLADHQLARKHLIQYQTNIKRLHSQFDRLQVIIDQLKKERQALYQKNLFLGEEIERLLQENKDLQTQTKDVRLRLSDESSLQKRINEHLGLMVILFTEIESLRKRVVEKQKEVQHVRRTSLSPHMMKH